MSIFNELRPLFHKEALTLYPYPLDIHDGRLITDRGTFNENWFHLLDRSLHPGKYVIFIEGADRLKDVSERLNLYNWISTGVYWDPYGKEAEGICNMFENLRIIVSGTPMEDDPIAPCFNTLSLGRFSFSDKEKFLRGFIGFKGRTISPQQTDALRLVLPVCEPRPIYLEMLGRWLSSLESYRDIGDIPPDLKGLADMVITGLESSGVHNRRLVRTLLALIITSASGLDLSTINGVLACDERLVHELRTDSFHDFEIEGRKGIPPILVSRLYSDLEGIFLHTLSTTEGRSVMVRHPEIRNLLRARLSPD